MKVSNDLRIYEENGQEITGLQTPSTTLTVRSHWNRDSVVVLELAGRNGPVSITVSASELRAAIINATNTK